MGGILSNNLVCPAKSIQELSYLKNHWCKWKKKRQFKVFWSELSSSNRDNSDSDTRTFFFKSAVKKTRIMDIFFSFVLFIFWFLYFFLYACIRLDNRATLRNLRKVIGCCRSNLYQLFLIPEGITVKVRIILEQR